MNDSAKSNYQLRHRELAENLRQRFQDSDCEVIEQFGEVTMRVPRERLVETALELRDAEAFHFEQLIDACGIDYLEYGRSEWETTSASVTGFGRGVASEASADVDQAQRFAAVYHLLSVEKNHRLRLRVSLDSEQPIVDSLVDVWPVINWFEREAFDLYGILFNGHPDLRRILTDYGFVGHPFRKDFPLIGEVEMRYDMEKQRVVYEPVSIEPRTLVPKVIRDDNRYLGGSEQQDSSDA